MTLPSWLVPTGAVVAILGIGAGWFYDSGKKAAEAAELQAKVKGDESTIQALNVALDSAEKKTRVDSVPFVRVVNKITVKHDTVMQHLTDTVLVKQFIAEQDTAIKSCSVLVSDCQAQVGILKKELAATQDERDAWKKQAPSWIQRQEPLACATTGAVGLVAGILLGRH